MSKETTATFIGHKECYGVEACDIREEVIKLIEMGITDFLNGGMGHFDWMCAKIVFDLKKDYPHIHNYLVIPYLTFNILEKNISIQLSTQKALKSIISSLQFRQGTSILLRTLLPLCAM